MNKFGIFDCADLKEKDYQGFCVVLACISDPNLMLFFPIPKEHAKTLKSILESDGPPDFNNVNLGVYKTMIDSWTASDRFLSGILFDVVWSEEAKDEVIQIKLAISDITGHLDGIVPCNFLHAILLAAMDGTEIIISDKLLSKMLPNDEECPMHKEQNQKHSFPEDKKIMSIAKKIMTGKIKDN